MLTKKDFNLLADGTENYSFHIEERLNYLTAYRLIQGSNFTNYETHIVWYSEPLSTGDGIVTHVYYDMAHLFDLHTYELDCKTHNPVTKKNKGKVPTFFKIIKAVVFTHEGKMPGYLEYLFRDHGISDVLQYWVRPFIAQMESDYSISDMNVDLVKEAEDYAEWMIERKIDEK